jgi:hypothetical protein
MSTEVSPFPHSVRAAPVYDFVDDLWLLTTYFNPAKYESKRRNYEAFAGTMASSGLRLVTIECAFGDSEFELPDSPDAIRVRASDVMWQKERLLNIAVSRLPEECRKIVCIDFDIYFENAHWAVETSRILDDTPLVQPFARGVLLPPRATFYEGEGRVLQGFAATFTKKPDTLFEGIYQTHGHAGWAWGIRRELLDRHGLYDAGIIGGGDHLMAHAASGSWTSACLDWALGKDKPHYHHFVEWAESFHDDVQGRVGYVSGTVLHTWHGRWRDRDYTNRHAKLREFGFDPKTDLRLGESGCWEWASDKPELHAWAMEYFAARHEDGDPAENV